MRFIKSVWARLRAIPRRTYLFSIAGVVVLGVATVGILYAWDYTNSPPFCGTTCHTMPPEYSAYQVSPHARVACVECHIGRGFVGNSFTRKAGDLSHVLRYSSNNYTLPIYASTMLPAREACEKCHWPEKFANDKILNITHYQDDTANTAISTLIVLKTGGGTEREGRGYGIHWHIENQVNFIATDDLKQNIPWVQVIDSNGNQTIYQDVEKPLTADQIAKADKHQMDCIDCHNRVSHTFQSPVQVMDQALTLNRIDPGIPAIHQKGVEVLSAKYSSFAEADKAIDGLDAFYSQNYPDFYQGGSGNLKTAIAFLKQAYSQLVFPGQDLSWTTHPDNLGHKDWPGCFRCHDGKHFTADNKNVIPLECNVCHTLPQVTHAGGPPPVVSIAATNEPDSHRSSLWLVQHRTVFNASCQQCHDTRNAGGSDNSSFCSNSACHGTKWTFAGFDAPALAKVFPPPAIPQPLPNAAPPKIPHPIGGAPDCQICHGPKSIVRPFPSDHLGRTNDQCLVCHTPSIVPSSPQLASGGPPSIPHDLAGRSECLGCHGSGVVGVRQVPQFHKDYGFANTACLTCHKSGLQVIPASAQTPAASATPTLEATPTSASTPASENSTPEATATSASTAVSADATATASAEPAGGPAALPADHVGRTMCTVCHKDGVGGAPKFPDSHAGRDDTMCLNCHKPKQ